MSHQRREDLYLLDAEAFPVDAPTDATWPVGDSTVEPYDIAVTDADLASIAPADE